MDGSDRRGWLIGVIVVLVLVGFVAFARGRDHHHGDDVGALGSGRGAPTATAAV
jgi:hypothetical protein